MHLRLLASQGYNKRPPHARRPAPTVQKFLWLNAEANINYFGNVLRVRTYNQTHEKCVYVKSLQTLVSFDFDQYFVRDICYNMSRLSRFTATTYFPGYTYCTAVYNSDSFWFCKSHSPLQAVLQIMHQRTSTFFNVQTSYWPTLVAGKLSTNVSNFF